MNNPNELERLRVRLRSEKVPDMEELLQILGRLLEGSRKVSNPRFRNEVLLISDAIVTEIRIRETMRLNREVEQIQ